MASTAEREKKFLPQDVLLAILVKTKEKSGKERLEFRAHEYHLQAIFYVLRIFYDVSSRISSTFKKNVDLLGCFVFFDCEPPSYSLISDSVGALQFAGCLCRPYPDWEVLRLNPAGEEYFEKVLKDKFSAEELERLGQIAADFLRFITPL